MEQDESDAGALPPIILEQTFRVEVRVSKVTLMAIFFARTLKGLLARAKEIENDNARADERLGCTVSCVLNAASMIEALASDVSDRCAGMRPTRVMRKKEPRSERILLAEPESPDWI